MIHSKKQKKNPKEKKMVDIFSSTNTHTHWVPQNPTLNHDDDKMDGYKLERAAVRTREREKKHVCIKLNCVCVCERNILLFGE